MDRNIPSLHETYQKQLQIQQGGGNMSERPVNYTDSEDFFFLNKQTGGNDNLSPIYENKQIERNIQSIKPKISTKPEKNMEKPPSMEQSIPYPWVPLCAKENPYNLEIPNMFYPIVKNYTINVDNPLTSNQLDVVNAVYQDYLEPSQIGTFNKNANLDSRLTIYNIIRNFIIEKIDGKEIDLANKNQRSILSYIKIIEANPNHYSTITNNPYKTNPFDIIVIKSGYPIKYKPGAITLSDNNVELNMRLYRLDNAEYYYPVIEYLKEIDLIPWRELLYYKYVLHNVIEPKVSPHFVFLYGYLMNRNKINYESLNRQREDPARYLSYKLHKKEKYKILVEQNELSKEPMIITHTTNSTGRQEYSGVGVLLIDKHNNILLINNKDTIEDIGGKLRNSFKQSVLNNVLRKTSGKINLDVNQLNDNYFYRIPDAAHPNWNYGSYIIKVNQLPYLNDARPININNIEEAFKNSKLKFHERTKKILNIVKTNETEIKNLKEISNFNYKVERQQPKYTNIQETETLTQDAKISLLILTESPDYNLYSWASRRYDSFYSTIKKMTNSGIHTSDVWRNVLFQILQGLYTMNCKNFCINKMCIENNIFIKNLPQLKDTHWVYNINGLKYYVKNLGYLVMFDLGGTELVDFSSKVIFNTDVSDDVWDAFVNIFKLTNFNSGNVAPNYNPPPQDILDLIKGIEDEATDKQSLNYLIEKHFYYYYKFPRVGKELLDHEKQHLSTTNKNFKKGDYVAYKNFSEEIFKEQWAVIINTTETKPSIKKDNKDINSVEIMYNDNIIVTVNKNSYLQKYISHHPIDQLGYDRTIRSVKEVPFPTENEIDTYIIS
jgi:hypothetical protein